LFIKAHSLV